MLLVHPPPLNDTSSCPSFLGCASLFYNLHKQNNNLTCLLLSLYSILHLDVLMVSLEPLSPNSLIVYSLVPLSIVPHSLIPYLSLQPYPQQFCTL